MPRISLIYLTMFPPLFTPLFGSYLVLSYDGHVRQMLVDASRSMVLPSRRGTSTHRR